MILESIKIKSKKMACALIFASLDVEQLDFGFNEIMDLDSQQILPDKYCLCELYESYNHGDISCLKDLMWDFYYSLMSFAKEINRNT